MSIVLKETILDGKRIVYSSETEFVVQSGRGPKGWYQTRMVIKGMLGKRSFGTTVSTLATAIRGVCDPSVRAIRL